jgi:hypothetical protein
MAYNVWTEGVVADWTSPANGDQRYLVTKVIRSGEGYWKVGFLKLGTWEVYPGYKYREPAPGGTPTASLRDMTDDELVEVTKHRLLNGGF